MADVKARSTRASVAAFLRVLSDEDQRRES